MFQQGTEASSQGFGLWLTCRSLPFGEVARANWQHGAEACQRGLHEAGLPDKHAAQHRSAESHYPSRIKSALDQGVEKCEASAAWKRAAPYLDKVTLRCCWISWEAKQAQHGGHMWAL